MAGPAAAKDRCTTLGFCALSASGAYLAAGPLAGTIAPGPAGRTCAGGAPTVGVGLAAATRFATDAEFGTPAGGRGGAQFAGPPLIPGPVIVLQEADWFWT